MIYWTIFEVLSLMTPSNDHASRDIIHSYDPLQSTRPRYMVSRIKLHLASSQVCQHPVPPDQPITSDSSYFCDEEVLKFIKPLPIEIKPYFLSCICQSTGGSGARLRVGSIVCAITLVRPPSSGRDIPTLSQDDAREDVLSGCADLQIDRDWTLPCDLGKSSTDNGKCKWKDKSHHGVMLERRSVSPLVYLYVEL